MTHGSKIILLVIVLAGLFLTGCAPVEYSTQSSDIQAAAQGIAGYTAPESYREQFTAQLFGYQIVSLTGPTASCHIYLAQAPEDADISLEALKKRAADLEDTPDSQGRHARPQAMRIVERRGVKLRGSEVTLLVSEGVNSEEQRYRDASALFSGRGGPALVSISAPVEQWDWELVNGFLASIE